MAEEDAKMIEKYKNGIKVASIIYAVDISNNKITNTILTKSLFFNLE